MSRNLQNSIGSFQIPRQNRVISTRDVTFDKRKRYNPLDDQVGIRSTEELLEILEVPRLPEWNKEDAIIDNKSVHPVDEDSQGLGAKDVGLHQTQEEPPAQQ